METKPPALTTNPVLPQSDLPFSVEGQRVALLEFEDQELLEQLLEAGAMPVTADDPSLELLVVDTPTLHSRQLRSQLSATALERLLDGRLEVIGRQQLAGVGTEAPGVRRSYTRPMLADVLGVSVSTLRDWERRQLIQPVSTVSKLAYFDYQNVCIAKQIATMADLGVSAATLQRHLQKLAARFPHTQWPPGELSVCYQDNRLFFRVGDGLIEPGGQRRIEFQNADEEAAAGHDSPRILPFTARSSHDEIASTEDLQTPSQFIDQAERLQEAGQIDEAIEVYRLMQLATEPNPEVCLRIGELLYQLGDLAAARERYYMAIELDETFVEARAALGCVLAELGNQEMAIAAFNGALQFHAAYPDVHFQLARLHDHAGSQVLALHHWRQFADLSPAGPWLEEANSRIEQLEQSPGD